ncbi:MAG: hypothetical protein LRY63_15005 [Nitrincola sp.]|nr:hypothetical protein [Nitrincola sp.]
MESFEVKVAALSILALCVTAYLHFEPIWAWGFVLLIAIPLLVSRFPLIGYLFGAALLFLSAWLVSEGTTIYTLLLGLAIAIYGFFLNQRSSFSNKNRETYCSKCYFGL